MPDKFSLSHVFLYIVLIVFCCLPGFYILRMIFTEKFSFLFLLLIPVFILVTVLPVTVGVVCLFNQFKALFRKGK